MRRVCLAMVVAAAAVPALADECKVDIAGPAVTKVAACKGEQHVWTLKNSCGKQAVVRYFSVDAHRFGEVFVKPGEAYPLECCVTGNFTCRFQNWTTEFH
jgi:hypothetical protein